MHKSLGRRIFKWLCRIVGLLLLLVVLIPVLLYVPFVQDFVKDIAVKEASKATGMDIGVERLRLRWPLRLSVDGVKIIEASGDTMLIARRLDLGVKILPLIKGDVDVNYAMLDSAFYQMGNADSLMWLRAGIERVEIKPSTLKLNMERIALSSAELDGADIRLVMRPDTALTPTDTTASNPMLITADNITLRRVRYSMSMLPTIDSLGCDVPLARLSNGTVDLTGRRIHASSLAIDSVSAAYLTPSAAWLKANPDYPVAPTDTTVTPADQMWTITADSLRLTGRRALYAQRGVRPLPGLDMSYLEVSDITIAVDSFYNRGTEITVPLRRLQATERCGLTLQADGTFAMDSLGMYARGFKINTNRSTISLDASMGMGDITTDPDVPVYLDADARLSLADAVLAIPSLRPMVAKLPIPAELLARADLRGNGRRMDVNTLSLVYPGILNLKADGTVDNPLDANRMKADVNIDGRLTGSAALNRSLTAARLLPGINLPHIMTVKGHVAYAPDNITGNITATANNGRLALKGTWNGNRESYDAKLDVNRFPVSAFMPALGVGDVTATLSAHGRGYNPLSPATSMHVNLDVAHITYNQMPLNDIRLRADLSGGEADGMLSSSNPAADLWMNFTATTSRDSGYTWQLDGDVAHLDLRELKIMTDTCAGSVALHSTGRYNPRNGFLDASLSLDSLDWLYASQRYVTGRTDLHALLTDSLVEAHLTNGDLTAAASATMNLDGLMARVNAATALINREIADRNIDIDSLQHTLPPFSLMVNMGPENIASEYLASSGITIGNAAFTASNDSLISFNGALLGLQTGTTKLDTITVSGRQHGSYLAYSAAMNNRPGTFDEFAHVALSGFMGHDRLSAMLIQKNIKEEIGYRLGLAANVTDSVATLRFVPFNPIIAYRPWKVNPSNHVDYNFFTRAIDADLTLSDADERSSARLFTRRHMDGDSLEAHAGEDVVLQLDDIHIQDWLMLSPWAPPMRGNLSADLTVHLVPGSSTLTGDGTITLADFFYNNERVGTFNIDTNVETDPRTGQLRANLDMMVDSVKTITVSGTLNDSISKSPFLLDFNMIHFPLAVANPFLPQGMAKLSGMLNGKMDITGSMDSPVFNGWINFDSTAVNVTMLGTDFNFSDEKIPVDSGIARFSNFAITGCNDNPLRIDGTANLRDLANIGMDLSLKARNMMILNSNRARNGASAFGKAYIDLDATAKGNMEVLFVDASLGLLPGTNVTYVMPPSTSTLGSVAGTSDMVKFVNFTDTAQVARADSIARSMALILTAALDIHDGTTITVDITPDGASKAQIQGSGHFDFSMSPLDDGRLLGRYTIEKGMARYNVPMLGEKSFDINSGSYVAFTGNMLDPQLNLSAVDRMKANVTQSGQNSRLVNFLIGLNVTGTLNNMNVVFDLSTDDDITVQNELSSMSPEQRANQAINLLLYSTYTGPGTTANANLSGNPLFSFLESQVNTWMANNIKAVDISFGIDQYNTTRNGATQSATSYSYQVSKSLFDDRFKILVGGNYSTDAAADENFAQNLISDISFEYLLNRSGSMSVRIFRHTGFESILEGEVIQTGVGFVLRRKLHSFRDLWPFHRRAKAPAVTNPTDSTTHDVKK